MDFELFVCVKVERNKFQEEVFCGSDNILAIVKKGEFIFDCGKGTQTVGELEGVCFKQGIVYKRKVTTPLTLYLFRYKSDEDIFPDGKIVFKDTYRIKSTLKLIDMLGNNFILDTLEYKKKFLADIFNQYIIETECDDSRKIRDEVILNAIEVINKNISNKINLKQIAKDSYLSYIQFSRRFKAETGLSPQDYVNSVRMEKARYLLVKEDVSIKKIAFECGFANEYYFSKFFKKYNNITPSKYRKISSFSV